ncbi:MAG TPA: cytochrome c biogenesis protein ResB [Firmicutes bacterium]|nr:cytochrome c biogenesis protein ResB [Bacillota bacterium]
MDREKPGLSGRQHEKGDTFRQIIRFLSSMQLGIILLLLLAAISVFATLQEQQTAISNIYRSFWFVGIMAFAALNLLLCSVKRVGPLARLALRPRKVQTVESIQKMPFYRAVELPQGDEGDGGIAKAVAALKASGYQVSVAEGPAGKSAFAEKGRYGYFGSVLTHFGLLVILLGVMLGSLTGFEHRNGGIAGDSFQVPEGNFTVRIDNIHMVQEPDPTVRPRVYSNVAVTRSGRQIAAGTVAINEPLRFQGNTIYHMTFRYVSDVLVKNPATGEEKTKRLYDQDILYVDSQGSYIHFLKFFPNFTMTQQGMPYSKNYLPEKPVLAGVLYNAAGQGQRNVFLQLQRPEVIDTADGGIELTLQDFQHAAVFSVTRNLGRPLLFAGAAVLVLGLYLCLAVSPRRIYAARTGDEAVLHLGGSSYRGRLGMERELARIAAEIMSKEVE